MSKTNAPCPLIELRRILGVTQRELARMTDIPWAKINNVEQGRVRLSPDSMRQLRLVTGLKWEGKRWILDPAWLWILPIEKGKTRLPNREGFDKLQKARQVEVPDEVRARVIGNMAKALTKLGMKVPSRFWFTLLQEYEMFEERMFEHWFHDLDEKEDDLKEAEAREALGLDQESGHRVMRPQGASPTTAGKR